MQELSEDGLGRTTIRMASMRQGSNAKAKAKEEKTNENATTAEPPGISRESSLSSTKARARATNFKEDITIAEKLHTQPANAPRTREMQKEPGAREDTKEHGAKEDSQEKAKESGK